MKTATTESRCLAANLTTLRLGRGLTQEAVAEAVGVSRQAVAKWEMGESAPDIFKLSQLAAFYQVTLDDLVHFDAAAEGVPIPPKGKHIFGTVTLGERGQVVIPKKAREIFGLNAGDKLMVLGDEDPENGGLALVPAERFLESAQAMLRALFGNEVWDG